jgi:hypothetical protein
MLITANEPASRFLSRLTIRTKTFIAAAVVLICLIAMGAIVVLGSRAVARNLNELSSSNMPSRSAAVAVSNFHNCRAHADLPLRFVGQQRRQ